MIDSKNYTQLSPSSDSSSTTWAGLQVLPLDWTTPIAAILRDDFVLQDPWATTHITIEDALSHRTGMPRHDRAHARSYDGGRTVASVRDINSVISPGPN